MYKKDYQYVIKILKGENINTKYLVKDWYSLLGFLEVNKLCGYFYNKCKELNIALPKQIEALLNKTYLYQKVKNKVLRTFILKLSYELEINHINYAFLKGSILSNSSFNANEDSFYKIGVRVSNDIDILVSNVDLGKVEKILKKLNFKQGYYDSNKNKIIPFSRKEIINRRMNRGETAPWVLKLTNAIVPFVEIDINLSFNETAYDNLPCQVLNNTICYKTINHDLIRSLEKYDFIIHLIVHAYKELSLTFMVKRNKDILLYKFLDIYLLLNGNIDLLILLEKIKKYKLEKEAYVVINTTSILFNCDSLKHYLSNFPEIKKVYIKDYTNKKDYFFKKDVNERILNYDNSKYLKEIEYEPSKR